MKYYFSSDYHLGHFNIIQYCSRPFDTVEEMNKTIINNYNEIVKPEDEVFFLGDFSFTKREEFEDKFNGKLIFIHGNHDKRDNVKSISINYGGFDIYMNHWPQNIDKSYDINLVGHVHEKWKYKVKEDTLVINVGVDQWEFKPVSIGDIHKLINKEGLRCLFS